MGVCVCARACVCVCVCVCVQVIASDTTVTGPSAEQTAELTAGSIFHDDLGFVHKTHKITLSPCQMCLKLALVSPRNNDCFEFDNEFVSVFKLC